MMTVVRMQMKIRQSWTTLVSSWRLRSTKLFMILNLLYKDLQAKEKAWEEVASALGADSK